MYWDREVETIKQEELEKLQLRRLKAMLSYCYKNSPFYRKRFKDAGLHPLDVCRLSDVRKLPFTTKEDLRQGYPFGMLAVDREVVVRIHASSGTTGKPTIVAYTHRDIDNWAELMARVLTCAGVTKRDTIQLIYNYAFFTGGLGFHYGAERIGAAVIPAGVGNSEKQLLTMRDLKVTAFSSTPSYALHLAEFAREQGIDVREFSLRTGIFGAEPWSEEMRRRIEEAYGIKAYDNYGLSELCGPGVAVECEAREGLHIWSDHFLLEVIDPESGEVLGPGEKGELVFTTLTREAMPLLRYRTRDISMVIDDSCECGRTHPRIARLMGRSDDMLIIRGVNVFPSQVEHVLLQFPEVAEHYQIVVDRRRSMDVLMVKVEVTEKIFRGEPEELLKLKNRLEAKLRSVLGVKAEVTFVEPGTIPRSRGKAQRVVDLRNW
ncbi:phenylacetate--CoA ligase family protein [Candidatus Pyrohabitans sp.]